MPPVATVSAPTTTDRRVAAFCAPDGPEVFSGIVHGNQIWTPDPFDVGAVHPEARAAFVRLLDRASAISSPPHGKSLLLLGEAGSGKTHLMRAFRTAAHEDGAGYCGYLQMLSRSDNYPRYVLSYLIDSLEQPYRPGDPTTGLARIARGLLDALDVIPDADRQRLCDDLLEPDEVARLVFRFADIAVQCQPFAGIDINVLRAVLFLLPNDGRIRPKVLNWLRCEDLPKYDRDVLGGLVPRTGPEMPLKTIVSLGHLMRAVHSAALVLLVDQIDVMIELDRGEAQAGEQFRTAMNALIDITELLPNAVLVVGCLGELYLEKGRPSLPRPKLDRLEHDPEPISLRNIRTADEVRAIVARRLEVFFDAVNIETDPANPFAPYSVSDIAQLSGLTTRTVLDYFRKHRNDCIEAKAWVETSIGPPPPPSPPPPTDFAQLWNDFVAKTKPPIIDELKLAESLAWTISTASDEMPNGLVFATDPDDRFVQVEVQRGTAVDKLLVAICDRGAQGGGLKNQIDETVKRAGEIPAVFVRSTEFSKNPKAGIATQVAKLCVPVGAHRKTVVANADWRAMTAFRAFANEQRNKPGFAEWRRTDRPLATLPSLRKILDLDKLESAGPAKPQPPAPPLPPAGKATRTPTPSSPPVLPPIPPKPAAGAAIHFGRTRSAVPAPVDLQPQSLCRHAAFLGGSGSGKTTAALAIIEQLLLAGVPAVLLDRKGDLASYADPAAWTKPEPDADRATRRAELRGAIDVALYTPGADRGRPLAIPVVPAGLASAATAEREQIAQFAAAGLGAMMGYKSKGTDPKLVILQKAIEALAVAPGQAVTAKALQRLVADQDDALLAQFDGQYEDKHFKALATDLLSLSLRHRRLLEGPESLDVDALLGRGTLAPPGRTRLAVVGTQFLGDPGTVDFWVSQLLLAIDRWRAKNPAPEGALQAAFLFDEADAYLPAVGKPSTKGPMEGLLRRARSAGVGLFLATQSPGDLDYRCRDQILTWLIGRVKEPVAIGKLKPMLDSKPGAADKLADQKAGEFYLVREADVQPVQAVRNLIPTEQLPEERILELARPRTP
jgi:energy-coupling factor transporter ATP-binding protein EcfA2